MVLFGFWFRGGRGWCRLLNGVCECLERGGVISLKIFETLFRGSHHGGDVEGVGWLGLGRSMISVWMD